MDSLELASRDGSSINDQVLPSLLRVHERLSVIEARMATKDDLSREATRLQLRIDARPSKTFVIGTVLSVIGLVIFSMVVTPYLAP